jgi:hypothetical protein
MWRGLMFFDRHKQAKKDDHELPIEVAQLWYCLSPACAPKEWYVESDLIRRQTWLIAESDAAMPHIVGSEWPLCPHCAGSLHKQEWDSRV